MAVMIKGVESYKGAVLRMESKYWSDGMESEYAVVWDSEGEKIKRVQVGYYGSDGNNLCNGYAEVDCSKETAREMIRCAKEWAVEFWCVEERKKKNKIEKGVNAEVVRGRKVKKGTLLKVFWVGSRFNQFSRSDEEVSGCYDENGNKVWIKTEYLKRVDVAESSSAKERREALKKLVRKMVGPEVMSIAC